MIILVIGGTTVVGGLVLPPPLSSSLPMSLIQSAEAPTVTDSGNCFIGTPTIVGTNNDDVIQGTEGVDFIVGLGETIGFMVTEAMTSYVVAMVMTASMVAKVMT